VVEDLFPDLRPAACVKVAEVLLHRDAARERLVEPAHAVGGQEQDALVVLEQADEDADHGVALDVALRTLLHEDVCFVQQ